MDLAAGFSGPAPGRRRLSRYREIPTLRQLAGLEARLLPAIDARCGPDPATPEAQEWLDELGQLVAQGSQRAQERLAAIDRLARQAGEFAHLEYDFLFDEARHLLAIGYNVGERRRDLSYYDLLASEARLGTFVAIAQGEIPRKAGLPWGACSLPPVGSRPPFLERLDVRVPHAAPGDADLRGHAARPDLPGSGGAADRVRQDTRGALGISESGYNAVDVSLNYQYRAFGVPGLGLKRGLAEDLVVAPYASALALMVAPEAACLNLERLAAAGFAGKYGFYEAIDYTPSRLPRGKRAPWCGPSWLITRA